MAGLNESELDLSAAVEMLGLEDDDEKKHPLVNHGTYLAYLALRLLRIRDLQRTVGVFDFQLFAIIAAKRRRSKRYSLNLGFFSPLVAHVLKILPLTLGAAVQICDV